MLPTRDAELVQIVDQALADATVRARKPDGTSWLACQPGCTPCCHGVFRISALDAERLRTAFHKLEQTDKLRAAAIQARALNLVTELSPYFPGDAHSGLLHPEDETWDTFADLPQADAPCPVLDPATGRCDLYAARPLTCRIFGPPVQNEGGIGVCELCYIGAAEPEILYGEMHLQHHALEEELNQEQSQERHQERDRERHQARDGELSQNATVIAWALLA